MVELHHQVIQPRHLSLLRKWPWMLHLQQHLQVMVAGRVEGTHCPPCFDPDKKWEGQNQANCDPQGHYGATWCSQRYLWTLANQPGQGETFRHVDQKRWGEGQGLVAMSPTYHIDFYRSFEFARFWKNLWFVGFPAGHLPAEGWNVFQHNQIQEDWSEGRILQWKRYEDRIGILSDAQLHV